ERGEVTLEGRGGGGDLAHREARHRRAIPGAAMTVNRRLRRTSPRRCAQAEFRQSVRAAASASGAIGFVITCRTPCAPAGPATVEGGAPAIATAGTPRLPRAFP